MYERMMMMIDDNDEENHEECMKVNLLITVQSTIEEIYNSFIVNLGNHGYDTLPEDNLMLFDKVIFHFIKISNQ